MENDIKVTEQREENFPADEKETIKSAQDKKRRWPRWQKVIFSVAIIVCIILVGGVSAFYGLRLRGEIGLKTEGYQIVYNGKEYRYKKDIINILCLGIDKSVPIAHIERTHGYIGMADTIMLVSIDTKKHETKVISIPRDTMAEVQVTDEAGQVVQRESMQICCQYAYGNSMEQSNELTVSTISKLLYDIPIQRCCAINFEALPILNDAIGGVDVVVQEDIEHLVPELVYGEKVHLEGKLALSFVRARDHAKVNGSVLRTERQKQYVVAFVEKAKDIIAKDPTVPVTIFQELQKDGNMCTDITVDDITYLMPEVLKLSFAGDMIQVLPGESTLGKNSWAEYHLNEEEVETFIMDTFFEEM